MPFAEITVLVGGEGIGKSLLWVRIAAAVTTGRPLPEMRIPKRDPRTVAVIVTEDGRGEAEERLKLAGADMDLILWFGPDEDGAGAPSFARHDGGDSMRKLWEGVSVLEQPPAFLVVDAWLDTVDGGIQVKDGQQARAALAPWKTFASKFGTAVMLLTHTNRMQGATTRDRMGTTAVLRQKARMTLFADRPEGVLEGIYVGPDKANNVGIANALKFETEVMQVRPKTDDDLGTSARLMHPVDVGQTIHAEIASWEEQQKQADKPPTKAEAVADEIERLMQSRGVEALPVSDLDQHLKAMGFGSTAIQNGKRQSGDSKAAASGGAWEFRLKSSLINSTMSLMSTETNETNETEAGENNAWCHSCRKPFHFTDSDICKKCENK